MEKDSLNCMILQDSNCYGNRNNWGLLVLRNNGIRQFKLQEATILKLLRKQKQLGLLIKKWKKKKNSLRFKILQDSNHYGNKKKTEAFSLMTDWNKTVQIVNCFKTLTVAETKQTLRQLVLCQNGIIQLKF